MLILGLVSSLQEIAAELIAIATIKELSRRQLRVLLWLICGQEWLTGSDRSRFAIVVDAAVISATEALFHLSVLGLESIALAI